MRENEMTLTSPPPTPSTDKPESVVDPAELAIFIVEDDPAVRESLATVFETLDVELYSYPTAEQFLLSYLQRLEQSGEPRPGCIVLDVRMPGMTGLELHREINRRRLPLAVLVHTGNGNVPMSVEAMRQGAIDVLEKPCDPQTLRQRVLAGLERAGQVWDERKRSSVVAQRESVLTARESEVYQLLLEGLETKQIGHRLGISPSTVEKHRLKVFDKMGVDTVPRLIRFVLDNSEEKR